MNYKLIIDRYYKDNDELKDILLRHSKAVADKALAIADAHPELQLDRQFLLEAVMVHDIGIIKTNAPRDFRSMPGCANAIRGRACH